MTEKQQKPTPFRDWWRVHNPDVTPGASRADFARLRRCGTPVEALMERATLALAWRLGLASEDENRLVRVGVVAAVLAHVRADQPGQPFAERLGQGEADKKLLSPLRFGALMTAAPGAAQLAAFRRAVAVAGRAADVEDIGRSLMRWSEPDRIRWTFRYWGAGAAAPDLETMEELSE